jgi:hypothetical protein
MKNVFYNKFYEKFVDGKDEFAINNVNKKIESYENYLKKKKKKC